MAVKSRRRAVRAVLAFGLFVGLGLAFTSAEAMPGADVKKFSEKLKKAIAANSHDAVQEALQGLLEAGGADAVNEVAELVPKLAGVSENSYWQVVNAAGGFRDREALRALGDFIVKKKKAPFARDLLFALENNTSPYVTEALGQVLEKGNYDMQLRAADQLGLVATTASVDALIEALKREGDQGDPALRRRIMASLSTITKESMGDALNWIGWWEANRSKGLPEPEEKHEKAGEFASSTLNKDRNDELESVKRNPDRIVVLSAKRPDSDPAPQGGKDYNYDHMEQVLDGMKIPHKVVLKADFEKDPRKYLDKAWTVLINCNNIQTQCICPECARINNEKVKRGESIGGTTNRLYGCPKDCPAGHKNICYALEDRAVEALKAWVENEGGYLFTEDWGVVEVVEKAWPKLVGSQKYKEKQQGGGDPVEKIKLCTEATVRIVPGRGNASLPLLRGVFTIPRPPAREPKNDDGGDDGTLTRDDGPEPNRGGLPTHQWKIDNESPSVHLFSEKDVTVLMRSEELGKQTGGDESVAVTFRAGSGKAKKVEERKGPVTGDGGKARGKGEWAEELRGGRVLHCISHFGHQQSSKTDTFVLQNLILNFIMESNRQHGG